MKPLVQLIILIFSLSLTINTFSADKIAKITYKWVDKNGITQYTERPPHSMSYEKITVYASGGKEVVNVSTEEAENETEDTTDTQDEVAKANIRNCKIAEQNMKVLKNVARIRVSDEKGENRILSPEEKQTRINETQKQIDIYCENSAAEK